MGAPISLGLAADRGAGNPNYRLDVGGVLGRSVTVWGQNLVPFFLVGLCVYSPVLLTLGGLAATDTRMPLLQKLLELVANFLNLILAGAVTYGVFQQLHGRRADLGDVLRTGLARLGTVWGAAFLSGLVTAIGLCMLVVPGLVAITMLWVAVPVAVIESPGASASLERSRELTSGNRWRVFAIALVVGVTVFLAAMVVAVALGAVAGEAAYFREAGARQGQEVAWAQALQLVLLIPIQCLAAVAPVVAYHDLRIGKEGADVEDLLKVFE